MLKTIIFHVGVDNGLELGLKCIFIFWNKEKL